MSEDAQLALSDLRLCKNCTKTKPISEFTRSRLLKRKREEGEEKMMVYKSCNACVAVHHRSVEKRKMHLDTGTYALKFLERATSTTSYFFCYSLVLRINDFDGDYAKLGDKCTKNMNALIQQEVAKQIKGRIRTVNSDDKPTVHAEFAIRLFRQLSPDFMMTKLREVNMEFWNGVEMFGATINEIELFNTPAEEEQKAAAAAADAARANKVVDTSTGPVYDHVIEPEPVTEDEAAGTLQLEEKSNKRIRGKEAQRTGSGAVNAMMKHRHGPSTICQVLRETKKNGVFESRQEKMSRAVIYLMRKYPTKVNMYSRPNEILFWFWYKNVCTYAEYDMLLAEANNPTDTTDIEFWAGIQSLNTFMKELKEGIKLVTKEDVEKFKQHKIDSGVAPVRTREMPHYMLRDGTGDIVRQLTNIEPPKLAFSGPWRCAFCKHETGTDLMRKNIGRMWDHIQLKHAVWNYNTDEIDFITYTDRMMKTIGGQDSLAGWDVLFNQFKQQYAANDGGAHRPTLVD
jgi:hypothetical protein